MTVAGPPTRAEAMAVALFTKLGRRRSHADLSLLVRRGHAFVAEAHKTLGILRAGRGRLRREALGEIERLTTEITELLRGAEGPFKLFVVGSGNAGKSSLINALLGQSVAKVEAVACTWRIDVYAPPSAGSHLLDLHDERVVRQANELRSIVEDDEASREASEQEVQRLFRARRREVPRSAWRELKEQLRRETLYSSPWIEAHWGVAEHPELQGIWLVDTPGLKQEDPLGVEGSGRREVVDSRAREYYQKADGVLWVLDANVLASSGAREAVDQVKEEIEQVGGRADNVIAVINRLDLVGDGDPEAQARVLEDARARFGDFFREMVGFSALNAQPSAPPELRRASGLEDLVKAIDRRFRRRAAATRLGAKTVGLRRLEAALATRLSQYADRVRADTDDHDARAARIREDAATTREAQAADIKAWRRAHRKRISSVIEGRLGLAYDLNEPEARKRFVRTELFDLDRIRSEHRTLVRTLRRGAERLVERREEDASFSEFRHLRTAPATLSRGFDAVMPQDDEVDFTIFSADTADLFGEAAEWGWVRMAASMFSGGKKRALKAKADELLTRMADESQARMTSDIGEAEERLLAQLHESFASVHARRAGVERVHAEVERIRAANHAPIPRAGAPGLVLADGREQMTSKEIWT